MGVAEKLQQLAEDAAIIYDLKESIRQAIILKDVDVPETTSFSDYPEAINSIPTGGSGGIDELIVEGLFDTINGEDVAGTYTNKYDATIENKEAIRQAIIAKNVVVSESTPLSDYPEAIASIVSGTASITNHKVRWFDPYNGSLLKTEYVENGGNGTSPVSPAHTDLTFSQWSQEPTNILQDTDIGAMYNVLDGKTTLFISLNANTGLSPTLNVNKNTTALMTVLWGDGTSSTTSASGTVSLNKTYATSGSYVIKIDCSGVYMLGGTQSYNSLIGSSNYAKCLTKIFIGSNVTWIGPYAFYNYSKLRYVVSPATIQTVDIYSFYGCFNLESLAFAQAVTTINGYAFAQCFNLCYISLPKICSIFGNRVFSECYSLETAVIPSGFSILQASNFYDCRFLKKLVIPAGVTHIYTSNFYNCYSLESVSLPQGLIDIGSEVFINCESLSTIDLPASVTGIGTSAFSGCLSIKKINLPASVVITSGYNFNQNHKLEKLTIPVGRTLPNYAFQGCISLKEVSIPTGTILGSGVFSGCFNLKTVNIAEGILSISGGCFTYCSSLKFITLPASLTTISDSAFAYCSALSVVIIKATTPPTILSNSIIKNAALCIYVPDASVDTYKAAAGWSTFVPYIFPISQYQYDCVVTYIGHKANLLEKQIITSYQNSVPPSAPAFSKLVFSNWIGDSNVVTEDRGLVANYNTLDGKTYLFITLNAETGLSPVFYLWVSTAGISINFGDGTSGGAGILDAPQTVQHTYPAFGDYVVEFSTTGVAYLGQGSTLAQFRHSVLEGNYKKAVRGCYLGNTKATTVTFLGCINLSDLKIQNSMTGVPNELVKGCISMSGVVFPSTVTRIYPEALSGCSALARIIFLSTTPPTLDDLTVFAGIPSTSKIYVPDANVTAYKTAAVWMGVVQEILGLSKLS